MKNITSMTSGVESIDNVWPKISNIGLSDGDSGNIDNVKVSQIGVKSFGLIGLRDNVFDYSCYRTSWLLDRSSSSFEFVDFLNSEIDHVSKIGCR